MYACAQQWNACVIMATQNKTLKANYLYSCKVSQIKCRQH